MSDHHTRHLVASDAHPFGQRLYAELLTTHGPDRVALAGSLPAVKITIGYFEPTDLYLVTDPFPSPGA